MTPCQDLTPTHHPDTPNLQNPLVTAREWIINRPIIKVRYRAAIIVYMKNLGTSIKDPVQDLNKLTNSKTASPGRTAPRSDKPGALTTESGWQNINADLIMDTGEKYT